MKNACDQALPVSPSLPTRELTPQRAGMAYYLPVQEDECLGVARGGRHVDAVHLAPRSQHEDAGDASHLQFECRPVRNMYWNVV